MRRVFTRNVPGADAYPISTATWLLTYRDIGDRSNGLALTRMVWWATHDAQRFNNDLAYATVPAEITVRSEEFIRQITVQGQPIFPAANPRARPRRTAPRALAGSLDERSVNRP